MSYCYPWFYAYPYEIRRPPASPANTDIFIRSARGGVRAVRRCPACSQPHCRLAGALAPHSDRSRTVRQTICKAPDQTNGRTA